MSFAALLRKHYSFPNPELLEENLIDSDLLALLGDELDGEGMRVRSLEPIMFGAF